jgi:glycosyltransferase involved in cell wall biosynthesis
VRILHLIQKPQLRGAEIFACQLAKHLTDLGHEVAVVSLQAGNTELPWKGKHILLSRPKSNRLWDFAGWKKLAKVVSDFKPDIVQANAGDTLKYAVMSKLIFRWTAPIVFRNASVISAYINSGVVKRWNAFLFRRVNWVVSVTNTTRLDLLTLYPFMKDRIEVIPVGLNFSVLPIEASREKKYLLHVGGFTFEKNHDGLLRIFKRLRQLQPGLELWLAGDGPLRPAVENSVKEMSMESCIRFLGYQADVLSLIQQAKVLLLPSKIEGLPAVILEAMYARTPVVAFDVGGIAEVVQNGKTGWLVKAGDEDGFVKAVDEVLNAADTSAITERAHQVIIKDYDNCVLAKRFIEVYRKALKD